jgi:hypothetical protein
MPSLCNKSVQSQNFILERKININLSNQRLDAVLKNIESQGKFIFSYNTEILDIESLVTINEFNQSVKHVLNRLFGEKIKYIEKGNYIILQKANETTKLQAPKKILYTVSGYIIDKKTDEKIPFASLYEQTTLDAAITDQYGFYQLELASGKQPSFKINVRKENYTDTLIIVRPLENSKVDIVISPIEQILEVDSISMDLENLSQEDFLKEIEENKLANFFLSVKQKFQSENIKQYFNKGWQVSLIPGLSTNGILNSNIINDYSFNLIGGYSGGVNKLELGGFINIDKTNVKGLQLAGFSNIVGGMVNGLQMAGFTNTNFKSFKGAQLAGFTNVITDTLTGAQFAGFTNVIKGYTTGLQAAGFCNVVTKSMNGVQLGGFANATLYDLNNTQVAGFANYARNTNGIQVAGFMNVTAKKMDGVQVAGFLNYATEMSGVQLGFINLSFKSDGVPIGFFSFVGNGFHKFETTANDITPINIDFKTGVKQFYNIFSVGYQPKPNNSIVSFGYGIGHEFTLSKKIGLDLEIVSNQVYKGNWNYLNLWNKANLTLAWNITPHFGLVAGPNLNYTIVEKFQPQLSSEFANNFIPSNACNIQNNSREYKSSAWLGFNIGVRVW